MSKFRNLILSLKEETDWDDPTERYWDRSPVKVEPLSTSDNSQIKEKPINPVSNSDKFCIKAIVTTLDDNKNHIFYLKSNKPGQSPYIQDKSDATLFTLQQVEDFINKHDKKIITKNNHKFQLHFESERI